MAGLDILVESWRRSAKSIATHWGSKVAWGAQLLYWCFAGLKVYRRFPAFDVL